MIRRITVVAVLLFVCEAARASEVAPSIPPATPMSSELLAIRDQLVALEIEAALAAVDAILARPELPEATRAEALDLRAQAHVASDDLDAAEKDYRAILLLRADYVPARDVTSKKAMDRFSTIRTSMIGTIHLDLDPKDAALTLDDRPIAASTGGAVSAVAGERQLRAARKGFDDLEVAVHAVAGQDTLVQIRLVPNARSLVVRTDVDGVAVTLDGVASGATARPGGVPSEADAPATLVIEDVPIGEHEIRLAKPCFATESLQEAVSVDLADRSAKALRIVAMRPARTRVTATGAQYDGELFVDRERVASLPLRSFTICPGLRLLEVVAVGRVVWSGEIVAEETDVTLDLAPRPNAVLVGAEWPKAWAGAAAAWSLRGRVDAPAGLDLAARESWAALTLPPGSDLAIGVIPGPGDAHVVLYSPTLQTVEERAVPSSTSRPSWSVATIGAVLVDSGVGSVLVASIAAGGPAEKAGMTAGDRLLAVMGHAPTSAASARAAVESAGIGAAVSLDIATPSGQAKKIECVTAAHQRVDRPSGDTTSRVARAAWASVDAAAGGPDAAIALANLANLLDRSAREAAGHEAWRKVRAISGGTLAARAAYALGTGLQAAGKTAEAMEAFGQAKADALAGGDAVLAAAAIDRLADLGVAPR